MPSFVVVIPIVLLLPYVGTTIGILHETKILPNDWCEYIGDNILTCAINVQHIYLLPQACTELIQCVTALLPQGMQTNDAEFGFTDSSTEINEVT